MWPGPYGIWGSLEYLLASLDQSLQRMGLEYVDIFYSHRFDLETPLEETMGALDTAVRQGEALYVGISSYSAKRTREAPYGTVGIDINCAVIGFTADAPTANRSTSHHLSNRIQKGGFNDPERTRGRKYHLSFSNTFDTEP